MAHLSLTPERHADIRHARSKTQFPLDDPYAPRGPRLVELQQIAGGERPPMPPPPDQVHDAPTSAQVPAAQHVPTVPTTRPRRRTGTSNKGSHRRRNLEPLKKYSAEEAPGAKRTQALCSKKGKSDKKHITHRRGGQHGRGLNRLARWSHSTQAKREQLSLRAWGSTTPTCNDGTTQRERRAWPNPKFHLQDRPAAQKTNGRVKMKHHRKKTMCLL